MGLFEQRLAFFEGPSLDIEEAETGKAFTAQIVLRREPFFRNVERAPERLLGPSVVVDAVNRTQHGISQRGADVVAVTCPGENPNTLFGRVLGPGELAFREVNPGENAELEACVCGRQMRGRDYPDTLVALTGIEPVFKP